MAECCSARSVPVISLVFFTAVVSVSFNTRNESRRNVVLKRVLIADFNILSESCSQQVQLCSVELGPIQRTPLKSDI